MMNATNVNTLERWRLLPRSTRLLHVGAELRRLRNGLAAGEHAFVMGCIERAGSLLSDSITLARLPGERRELCRAREVLRGIPSAPDPAREARLLTFALVGER